MTFSILRQLSQIQRLLFTLILGAFLFQVGFLIQDKSPTTDEVSFHIVNGYSYLKTGDYRMSPATPAVLREWMALPWLFLSPELNLDTQAWQDADSVPFAVQFFYQDNRALADTLLYSARAMIAILGVGLLLIVYFWTSQLYGPAAGIFAMALMAFSPTIVGHSALATVDIGCTLFYVLTLFFIYQTYEKQLKHGLILTGICFGLCFGSKYTGILLLPVIGVIPIIKRGVWQGIKDVLTILALTLGVIWMSYGFEFKPLLGEGVPRIEEKMRYIEQICQFLGIRDLAIYANVQEAARKLPIPLSSWFLGLAGILRSHRAEYQHYFLGAMRVEPVWYLYLFAFAVKATVGFLMLLSLRLILIIKQLKFTALQLYMLLPLGIYLLATFLDSTGVGMRYMIPLYPLLAIWIGGLWKQLRSRQWKFICLILFACHAGVSIAQFPNNIAFFNAFAGGSSQGYRYLRGSDTDWGQELKSLKRYADQHDLKDLRLSLFGTRDVTFYNIPGEAMTQAEYKTPRKKVYAISVSTYLAAEWTEGLKPTDMIGNAIFIYDMRNP